MYVATNNGIYASTDFGDTWTSPGTRGMLETFVLSLTFDRQNNLYVGTYRGGVYKSSAPLTDVEERPDQPIAVHLEQNFPNPFNPTTEIDFGISIQSNVLLKIFNLLGQEVITLVDDYRLPGEYRVSWDAKDRPSGVYFYKLTITPSNMSPVSPSNRISFTSVKKMLVLR